MAPVGSGMVSEVLVNIPRLVVTNSSSGVPHGCVSSSIISSVAMEMLSLDCKVSSPAAGSWSSSGCSGSLSER